MQIVGNLGIGRGRRRTETLTDDRCRLVTVTVVKGIKKKQTKNNSFLGAYLLYLFEKNLVQTIIMDQ